MIVAGSSAATIVRRSETHEGAPAPSTSPGSELPRARLPTKNSRTHRHPLGRSADNFDFLIFSQTTFPAMLPSAEWDIGRVLN